MKHILLLTALVLLTVGCASTPTPAPTAAPATAIPTNIPSTTVAPTATALPPTPTTAPTDTPLPPTNTPIPTTPAPTATRTRVPVTRQPTAVITPTVVVTPTTATALKFGAPELIEPFAGQIHRAGGEDLVFSWRPVAALGPNECYLLTLRITNNVDQNYAQQSFIGNCGDPGDGQQVRFVLKRRAPAPDYAGLVEIAASKTPANDFTGTWMVTVVQDNGADPNNPAPSQYVPLSPTSTPFEFTLQG